MVAAQKSIEKIINSAKSLSISEIRNSLKAEDSSWKKEKNSSF